MSKKIKNKKVLRHYEFCKFKVNLEEFVQLNFTNVHLLTFAFFVGAGCSLISRVALAFEGPWSVDTNLLTVVPLVSTLVFV